MITYLYSVIQKGKQKREQEIWWWEHPADQVPSAFHGRDLPIVLRMVSFRTTLLWEFNWHKGCLAWIVSDEIIALPAAWFDELRILESLFREGSWPATQLGLILTPWLTFTEAITVWEGTLADCWPAAGVGSLL
jgi:hypothetical protein